MDLKIKNRKVDGVTVLDLDGRLVLGEATSELREKIKGLLASGEKSVLMNLLIEGGEGHFHTGNQHRTWLLRLAVHSLSKHLSFSGGSSWRLDPFVSKNW